MRRGSDPLPIRDACAHNAHPAKMGRLLREPEVPEALEQGVDGTEKPAIMGGSLGRKRRVDGKGAEADSSSSLKVCAGNLCGRLQEG